MRDDGGHRSGFRALVAALLGTLLGATAVRAEGVYGTFQTQYQRYDGQQQLVGGDGTVQTRSLQQEFWLRTLDMHHQDWARPDLLVESNLRYSDQSYLGQTNVTRTPMGSLRMIHPRFQVFASYQPASQTSSLSSQSGLNPDSVTSREVTSHNKEALVTGHFAMPNWPQVDASWINRRRDGAGSFADENTTRNLRLTLDRDRWSAYGGINDQALSSATPGAPRNTQQVWTGGGAYHYLPGPALAVNAQYDVSDVRGVASGLRRPSTVNHTGSLLGEWRPAPKWLGTASYQLRHVDFGTPANPAQTDHDASVIGRYLFTRSSSLLGGGGVRTLRNFLPEGGTSVGLQKYLTALASLDGRVRRNWNMTGGLSHTTNFDPGRAAYSVETVNGGSHARLSRRIQVDGTIQLSEYSDSAAASGRYANSWNVRVQGTPLRTMQLAFSVVSQRSGPGLLRPNIVSRGFVVDGTWKPATSLQVTGQYGYNSVEPVNPNRNSTRSLTARYQPSRKWQWYGSWTRSDQRAVVGAGGQLSSREVTSSRLQYEPNRQVAMTAGVTYNDPGTNQELKRLDLTLTWSFGR